MGKTPLRESWEQSEAAAPTPHHPRDKTNCNRRVGGAAPCWPHAPPPDQSSTAPRQELFPEPSVPPVTKESPGVTSSLPNTIGHFVGAPTLASPHRNHGNLWGSITGNLTMMKKWGGASNNQPLDLGRPSSYLQNLSSSAYLWLSSPAKPRWWCSVTRELSKVQVCSHPGRRAESAPPAVEDGSCPPHPLTRKLVWENLGIAWSGPTQSHPGRRAES